MQGDNEDVFSVILGSKYIVSLHLTLYLILNLNFNLTFCNLLFFSIISSGIIGFLCTAFLGICLGACFSNIVDFQNRITDFAHNIHKIITCKNNEYIEKAHCGQFNCAHSVFAFSMKFKLLYYHDWMILVNKMKIKQ